MRVRGGGCEGRRGKGKVRRYVVKVYGGSGKGEVEGGEEVEKEWKRNGRGNNGKWEMEKEWKVECNGMEK